MQARHMQARLEARRRGLDGVRILERFGKIDVVELEFRDDAQIGFNGKLGAGCSREIGVGFRREIELEFRIEIKVGRRGGIEPGCERAKSGLGFRCQIELEFRIEIEVGRRRGIEPGCRRESGSGSGARSSSNSGSRPNSGAAARSRSNSGSRSSSSSSASVPAEAADSIRSGVWTCDFGLHEGGLRFRRFDRGHPLLERGGKGIVEFVVEIGVGRRLVGLRCNVRLRRSPVRLAQLRRPLQAPPRNRRIRPSIPFRDRCRNHRGQPPQLVLAGRPRAGRRPAP